MLDFLTELVSFVLGAITGSLVTIQITRMKARGRANLVNQSKSEAGGDIVGRDKIVK